MVVKTAVLKYCNHPSKRPGVRLAAGSVVFFVLNLSYFYETVFVVILHVFLEGTFLFCSRTKA